MLAPDQALTDFTLPAFDARALVKRAALPALAGAGAIAAVLVLGGRVHTVAAALNRVLDGSPGWALAGVSFECLSLCGYVALLSLVAGRATPRIGLRESAHITFAGAAATRLLPTAGAGGGALAVWSLRRAGLKTQAAARTLLVFFVLLYSVFLATILAAGVALAVEHGPSALSTIPAAAAALGIALALGAGYLRPDGRLRLIGQAVRDARRLIASRDAKLAGAVAYWLCDAAVLWTMLHAFGTPPPLPVIALAYFLGQVANTIPLPGSVSGGMVGALIAFGVPVGLALPAVLAYRTVSVWLPPPAAVVAIPGLRAAAARWARDDG